MLSNPLSTPLAIQEDSKMSQIGAPDLNSMNLELDTRAVIPYEPPEKNPYILEKLPALGE